MKIEKKQTYSEISCTITTDAGDKIEVFKTRKFGAPGWCPVMISGQDDTNKHIFGTRGNKYDDLDGIEQFAKALLKAIKIARQIEVTGNPQCTKEAGNG